MDGATADGLGGKPVLHHLLDVALVAIGYYLSARLGLSLAFANKNVTTVWPPTGIAVAALVLRGRWVWPGITVGAIAANLSNGAPLDVALGIAVGNTIAPLLAAFLLRGPLGLHPSLDRLSDVLALVMIGGAGSMLVSATLGTTTLALSGQIAVGTFWSTWVAWWVGDAMGVILFAPLVLTLASIPPARSPAATRLPEALLCLVITSGVSVVLCASALPIQYLVFPLVAWATLRFRQQGAALAVVIVAAASISTTVAGLGPQSELSVTTRLIGLDLFNVAVALAALIIAAATEERTRAHEELRIAALGLEDRVDARTRELSMTNDRLTTEIVEKTVAQKALQDQTGLLVAARDAAETANNAKSEYLSRMSHELRTPLTAIIGYTELMEMQERRDDERSRLGAILKASDHLLTLVDEVLDIARIESGHQTLTVGPVAVGDICAEAVNLMASFAASREVVVTLDAGHPDGIHVAGDQSRLLQVVLNLVSNAIKYGGRATEVSVRRTAAGPVRIAVSDSGPGLSPDQLERLFEPFERLGAERTETEGTGLGLALSKKLVEAMGGRIGVDSRPGRGATFCVDLEEAGAKSVTESATRRAADHAAEAAPETRHTVLYVEDNMTTIALVEEIFRMRPQVNLLTAIQGGIAIELAREHRPDLVLLDLHLPDIPGDEVIRRLRADVRTRDVPIILLSADATRQQIDRLLTLGARAYLTKPIRVANFLSAVDHALAAPALTRTSR